jgi:hypothetical protein
MLLRLRLMLISLGLGTVLFMLLCLGAQNLKDRHSIRVGPARSVPLPTGFLVGLSLVIGVVSGTSAAAVMLPEQLWD